MCTCCDQIILALDVESHQESIRKTPDTQTSPIGRTLQASHTITPQVSHLITKQLPAEAVSPTDTFKQPPTEVVKQALVESGSEPSVTSSSQPPSEAVSQAPTEESNQPVVSAVPRFIHHRRRHSRGHSVTKVELTLDEEPDASSSANPNEERGSSVTPQVPAGTEQTDAVKAKDIESQSSVSLPPALPEDTASAELARFIPSPTPPPSVVHLRQSHHLPRPLSAGSNTKLSPSIENSIGELPKAATEREPSSKVRSTTSALDVSRRISAPPIHLINLFEPLPSGTSTTSPPRAPTDVTTLQKSSSLQENSTEPHAVTSFSSLPVSGSTSPIPPSTSLPSNSLPSTSLPSTSILTTSTPQQQHPSRQSIPFQLSVDSEPLSGVEDLQISRIPSHPSLAVSLSQPERECDLKTDTTIMRARSVTQLQEEPSDVEDASMKRRSLGGLKAVVPGYTGSSQGEETNRSHSNLLRDYSGMRGSLEQLREGARTAGPSAAIRLPLSHQNSPTKIEKDPFKRRISADPEKSHLSWMSKAKGRPRSMIETSSFHHGHHQPIDLGFTLSSDFLAQLFWTSVSLLESDYEGEVLLALRLLKKAISELDLRAESTHSRLEAVLKKMKWENFPGEDCCVIQLT